jgi:hypothetical protein
MERNDSSKSYHPTLLRHGLTSAEPSGKIDATASICPSPSGGLRRPLCASRQAPPASSWLSGFLVSWDSLTP